VGPQGEGDAAGTGPGATPDRHTGVTGSQGVQLGDHNRQFNLFVVPPPPGPVVAGNVPQAPPAFQPREDLMAQLRAHGPGVSVVRAVTGLRGVGKTQVAAAYARECRHAGWRLIAWVNAESASVMADGLAVVADRLGIDRGGKTLDALGIEVRNRLEADGEKCLIVFDNVTDPDELRPYVPSMGAAQAVITSTESAVTALGSGLRIAVFTEEQALAFLSERTGRQDQHGARELARELGYLPLALSQAAAVIAAQYLTYPVYLDRLRSYATPQYLPHAKGEPYPQGVAEAILLSIDGVTAADPTGLCGVLLENISLLSADGLSRDFLYDAGLAGSAAVDRERVDRETVDEALGRLAGASLLAFSGGTHCEPIVTAHRLVMRVVRERSAAEGSLLSAGTRTWGMLSAAIATLGQAWQQYERARDLVRQVMALNDHLAPYLSARDGPLDHALLAARCWVLSCLIKLGDDFGPAVALGQPVVSDCARVLGETHPDTLASRHNLAMAYWQVKRLGEALPLLERTLADRELVLGEDHPDTLQSRITLADAYRDAGQVEEAVALLEGALADHLRVLGDDHPGTMNARVTLAAAYWSTGRRKEAVPVIERTLADRVRVLGEDHPETFTMQNNLAFVYRESGRLAEAVALLEKSLARMERVWGAEHRRTVIVRDNLALARREAGRGGPPSPV
jgi:tetratricopeptide (TPR) repeat protein